MTPHEIRRRANRAGALALILFVASVLGLLVALTGGAHP